MKKTILSLLTLIGFFILNAQAQSRPYDFPLDSFRILDIENPERYSVLSEQVRNVEDSIDFRNCIYVYYVSAYQENFSGLAGQLISSEIYNHIEEKEYQNALEKSLQEINRDPASVEAYYLASLSHYYLGDTLQSRFYNDRFVDMLSVPFLSGEGSSLDEPFIVSTVRHEYLIMGELGMNVKMQELIHHNGVPIDVLTAEDEKGEEHKFYFDVTLSFRAMKRELGFDKGNNDSKKRKKKKSKKKKRKEK